MGYAPVPIRIVVADEHLSVRQGLRNALQAKRGIHVLGEAVDAREVLNFARRYMPDVLLLDLDLLRSCELHWLDEVAEPHSAPKIIAMITAVDKAQVVEAFCMGAHGIVLKSSPPRLLVRSIRNVVADHYWLDTGFLGILVETVRELLVQSNGHKSVPDYGLTPRELDIISEIVSGRSNREVSQEFSISERTVKHHLTNIFNKLGVTSRLGLALFAVNHRLMSRRHTAVASNVLGSSSDNEEASPVALDSGVKIEGAVLTCRGD